MDFITVAVSGGFDPLHIGHIECFKEASKLGSLVVILDTDECLFRKKGYVFMSFEERKAVIQSIRYVDRVVSSLDTDNTICKTLEWLKPDVLVIVGNGVPNNFPEEDICKTQGIKLVFNVGGDKIQSSSWLLEKCQGYRSKKIIVFDLDGVLAESKASLSYEMRELLENLLMVKKVAIISGASLKQIMKQVVSYLTKGYENLYLLPTCGSRMFVYKNEQWEPVFQNLLTEAEKTKITSALNDAIISFGHNPQTIYGPIIEDRETQITFSALGQEAPLDQKEKWDPSQIKRQAIKKLLDVTIPEFEVRLGGTTSIDVTRKGIDKAFGVSKLMELYGYELNDIVFVGDALYPGGNDRPVKDMKIQCEEVLNPEETKSLIKFILKNHLS